MMFLRTLSKVTVLIPVIMLGYDLIYEWFVKARVKIGTFKIWYTDMMGPDGFTQFRNIVADIFGGPNADALAAWPGCVVMLIPPAFFYLLYRIIFAIQGGKSGGGGGFVYKSQD